MPIASVMLCGIIGISRVGARSWGACSVVCANCVWSASSSAGWGVHRVTAAVGLVQAPCLALVGLSLRRLPRNRRLVVLGSPLDRFADNAAYLFLHMAGQAARHRLEVVWISGSADVVQRLRSHGYRAEHRWSWRGALTTLGAGTFVYSGYRSDINRWLSPGATAVCLWHGLPIKRVESAVGGEGQRRSGLLRAVARAGREARPTS